MKKRFIVLIDLSDYSRNLLKYAYDWSLCIDAELLLVHQSIVLSPAFTERDTRERMATRTNDKALDQLKELVNDVLPPTEKISYSVSENQVEFTLSDLLNENFENLIFVGLKGTSLLKKIFLGSVAVQVIENTNNIVVAIPQEISRFSHEKIFVAVTEKYPLNILELNNFLQFIDEGKTTITFFYLAKPNEKLKGINKQLEDLARLFSDRFETTTAIFEGGNAFEEIRKVINNKIEELLIVQKGSRLLTDQLFRKFLINELVYEGETPLVVLP